MAQSIFNLVDSTNLDVLELEIPDDCIGALVNTPNRIAQLHEDHDKDRVYGIADEEKASKVPPGILVVADSPDGDCKIFCRIIKTEFAPVCKKIHKKKVTETSIICAFLPFLEKSDNYEGPLRPRQDGVNGWLFREPTKKELYEASNLPSFGIPFGWHPQKDDMEILFPFTGEPPFEDSIYQGILAIGSQDTGKTTMLRYLSRLLTTWPSLPEKKRPSIIFFDADSQFTKFSKVEELPEKTRNLFLKHGIGEVNLQVFKLADDPVLGNATLSSAAMTPEDFVYLCPGLPAGTESNFLRLMKDAYETLRLKNLPLTFPLIRKTVMEKAEQDNLVFGVQRKSIGNALYAPEMDIFDQNGKTEITIEKIRKPGTISVLDVENSSQASRRIESMYLAQMLHSFKQNSINRYPSIILGLDEAEKIFPKATQRDKAYTERIANRIQYIVEFGRKRNFGVWIVSHLPSEIDPVVAKLPRTKIAFQTDESEKWIKSVFGSEFVRPIQSQESGVATLRSSIAKNNQKVIKTQIRFPYVY